jgi:type I restriction enzyme M protein
MLGAIVGDIVGSRFEFDNIKTKDFDFFREECFVTDDSIMTLAIGKAIMECNGDYTDLGKKAIKCMQQIGRPYLNCGYGGNFYNWMYNDEPRPYNSFGNGAAMRVSGCGLVADSLEQAKELSARVTEISHNHPEGIKGAEATTVAIFLAREGKTIPEIRDYIDRNYYPMNFTLDEIREGYLFKETCQDTVPQAIEAFLESTDFEDAVRNAISLGGDSDTLAAIAGSIAEAYYGVPEAIEKEAVGHLDNRLKAIYDQWVTFMKDRKAMK